MLQCVLPHSHLAKLHAPVSGDGCAHIVTARAACGAVGHDVQAHAAAHEVQSPTDAGAFAANAEIPRMTCNDEATSALELWRGRDVAASI